MLDATRSPRPLWKRITQVVLVAALIVGLSWIIWVRELHHNLSGRHSTGPAVTLQVPFELQTATSVV